MLNWDTLFAPFVVAVVPVIIAFLKRWIPDGWSWVFPALAGAIGPAVDFVSMKATGVGVGPVAAIGLGLAGVGLREFVSQLKGKVSG